MSERVLESNYEDEFFRSTETLDANPTIKICLRSEEVLNVFKENIKSINLIIKAFNENTNDDLLRYIIVLLCSSIDNYMHNIVKVKIANIFNNKRAVGKKYDTFLISLSCCREIVNNQFNKNKIIEILDKEVYERMETISMHSQKAIDENLKYITSIDKIWVKIAHKFDEKYKDKFDFNKDTGKLQAYFKEIVVRRNKIVHESDRDYKTYDKIQIDIDTVNKYKEFITIFIEELHDILKTEDYFDE